MGIQPIVRGGKALSRDVDAEELGIWHSTAKGGQGGFYVVILSMAMWSAFPKKDGDRKKLDDVLWVMDKSIAVLHAMKEKEGGKRTGDEHPLAPISKQ